MEHQRAVLRLQAFDDFGCLFGNLDPVHHVGLHNIGKQEGAKVLTGATWLTGKKSNRGGQ
jgi:hypothetical protein